MATRFTGQGGSVTLGAVIALSVAEFKISESADKVNTTSTGDAGFKTSICAPRECEITFKAYADSSAILSANLHSGLLAQSCTLVLGAGAPHQWVGSVNITKLDIANPAEESVSYDVTAVSTGSYTMPS